jgi:hypothetical protein
MANNLAPGAEGVGSYKGNQVVNQSGAPSANTTFIPRHSAQVMDPALMPHMARRQTLQERAGAAYGITVNAYPKVDPTLAPTQANGVILNPKTMRSATLSFGEGMDDFSD